MQPTLKLRLQHCRFITNAFKNVFSVLCEPGFSRGRLVSFQLQQIKCQCKSELINWLIPRSSESVRKHVLPQCWDNTKQMSQLFWLPWEFEQRLNWICLVLFHTECFSKIEEKTHFSPSIRLSRGAGVTNYQICEKIFFNQRAFGLRPSSRHEQVTSECSSVQG